MAQTETGMERYHAVAEKLLDRIEAIIETNEKLDIKGIKTLTSAVKELKAIQSVQTEPERNEQLVFDGLPERFAV